MKIKIRFLFYIILLLVIIVINFPGAYYTNFTNFLSLTKFKLSNFNSIKSSFSVLNINFESFKKYYTNLKTKMDEFIKNLVKYVIGGEFKLYIPLEIISF